MMRIIFCSVSGVVILCLFAGVEMLTASAADESQFLADSSSEENPLAEFPDANAVVAAADDQEHSKTITRDDDHGPGAGRGPGRGRGFQGGRGPGGAGGFRADMTTIHSMFDDRDKIRRIVKLLPDGAEAVTESDDPKIAALIQDHVPNVENRVLENEPLPPMTFHPVFTGLIKNADKYSLHYEDTDKGVKVTYQSDDPYVVMLVQEHAKLVSRFIQNGRSEIHADFKLPEFSREKAAAQAKALTARGALFSKLSGRLTEVMKARGPAAAIEVCSNEALPLAESVGKVHGVKIGRTSTKLRNEKNSAPDWAKQFVKKTPVHGTFVELPDHRMGALLPIRLQQKCVTCHGATEQMAPDVTASLSKFYPNDQATGYKVGDLRGWFWVEVPVE